MLGGKAVGDPDGLLHVAHTHKHGVGHRLGQMLGARGELRLPGDLFPHRRDQSVRIAEQDHDAACTMLRLGKKIGGHPGRIRLGVGDHQHLAGTGEQVDSDPAEDLALGLDDIGVAGAEDLGHGTDRPGAVGQRGDRLRSADTVNLCGPAEIERREQGGGDASIRGGGRHGDDFGNPGGLCKTARHDGAGNKGSRPPGDVEADPGKRVETLSDESPLGVLHRPVFAEALFCKRGHVCNGCRKGLLHVRSERGAGFFYLCGSHTDPGRRQSGAAELRGIIE